MAEGDGGFSATMCRPGSFGDGTRGARDDNPGETRGQALSMTTGVQESKSAPAKEP
jgi:hypothetical protein